MFTRRQMSQLGAGGGGRPPRPRPDQVRNHLVNLLWVGLGGAAGRSKAEAVRTSTASSPSWAPGRLDFPIINKAHQKWHRSTQPPDFRRRPGGG